MAKIVELFGPPGVGKTTICKEVEAKWESEYKWIPASNLFPPQKKTAISPKINIAFINKLLRQSNIDYDAIHEVERNFIASHPKLMDAFWKNICYNQKRGFNGIDIRFEKSNFLRKRIQKIQFVSENKTSKICLVDEGITQMIPGAIYKSKNSAEEQKEIYSIIGMCPLPVAIINIDTDTKEIANRLYQRNKVNPMHKNLTLSELESITELSRERRKIITKILEEAGMPMLKIDSRMNSADNALKIISFLNNEFLKTNIVLKNNFNLSPTLPMNML
ncbi:MAG: hypothetical protein ABIO81_10700 [Ginsengibacter sp.]